MAHKPSAQAEGIYNLLSVTHSRMSVIAAFGRLLLTCRLNCVRPHECGPDVMAQSSGFEQEDGVPFKVRQAPQNPDGAFYQQS